MKKLITIFIFMFVFSLTGQSVRIITNFDIASWYLDADLVLICNVRQTETINISHFDTLVDNGFHDIYDIVKEKYQITIDSIIKGEQLIDGTMDTIFTPLFSTQSRREKTEFTGFDANGDSVFTGYIQITGDYNDYSYFRINSQEKQLVILHKAPFGYVIDYKSDCDEYTMNLIREVKMKGEDYFSFFFPTKVDTLPVYDHYCESMNPHEIDTTIFSYQQETLTIRNVKSEFCCPRKLQALVKNGMDTLEINVVNPDVADCTCDCSYGYTVKIPMAPFDTLNLRINKEDFKILKSDLESSFEDLVSKNLFVYPNPFTDKLNLIGAQAKRIEVTNINGETKRIEIQDPQCIDLNSLKPGVYVISIFTGKFTWKEKIIKE